jgi:hypothetical protein
VKCVYVISKDIEMTIEGMLFYWSSFVRMAGSCEKREKRKLESEREREREKYMH